MIDVGSIEGLHTHDHELHCYCLPCDRWVVLDLAAMIRAGQGERRLPIVVRCRDCGQPGQLQVRPPVPPWTNSNGWINPVSSSAG